MPVLSDSEIESRLASLPGWERTGAGELSAIVRSVKQPGFLAGLALVAKVAVLAEQANHHPDVLLTYPGVRFTLTTHDAGGVTEKDFSLAAEIDALLSA